MPRDSDLVTVAEAAAIAEVSPVTIHRRIKDGRLKPFTQLPGATGAYLLRRRDVEKMVAAK